MVEIMVGAAVVIGLTIAYVTGNLPGLSGKTNNQRKDGVGETIVGKSVAAAKDAKCTSNIRQVRLSIQTQMDPVENTFPESLKSLNLGADFEACPLGKEPYVYDPATGTVKCVHPGHEKY